MKVLEIGPAVQGRTFEGCITVDAIERPGVVDYVRRWGYEPLPFDTASFDMVYASHVLEHIPWYKTANAMSEAYRVLRVGGALEVWVPDLKKIVDGYVNAVLATGVDGGRLPEDWTPFNEERDIVKWVAGRLMCGTREGEDSSWHRALFDERYLARCFTDAGFAQVHLLDRQPEGQLVNHEAINLGIRGRKLT